MHIAINAIPISPGGGLTVMVGVIHGLRAARPNCRITVLCRTREAVERFTQLDTVDDVRMVLADRGELATFAWQQIYLTRYLADVRPDVVLTVNHYLHNCGYPQIVYHLNLRRFSKLYRESRAAEIVKEGLRDWTAKQALRHASANVFESRFLREAAVESTAVQPVNSRVIYIGLPDEVVLRAAALDDIHDGRPQLVSVTSDNPHKDTPTLIGVMQSLRRLRPETPWHLVVSGFTPPERWKPFQDLAAQAGVADAITWRSGTPQEELDQIMRRSLCMVNTSVMESFAMVPVEAMARRCPAVVADCASMPESVGDAGLLAEPHQADSFAEAILRVHDSRELRSELVRRGLRHIDSLKWSTCGQSFAALFEEIGGFAAGRTKRAA
jgi:glycosyltransferase involved in cell wall biosynthesis